MNNSSTLTKNNNQPLIINASPNTITNFRNFTVYSPFRNESRFEFIKPTFFDKLDSLFGIDTKKREESINDFFKRVEETEHVRYLEFTGKAKAYSRTSPSLIQTMSDYSITDPEHPLMLKIIPDFVLAKRKVEHSLYGLKKNFIQDLKPLQENIQEFNQYLGLQYAEKEEAGISRFNVSSHSLLRVKETSQTRNRDYDLITIVNQTANLGFYVQTNETNNKIFFEEYLIKLNVQHIRKE